MLKKLLRDEQGQDMIEYALLTALIGILLIVAITAVKDQIVVVFGKVVAALS